MTKIISCIGIGLCIALAWVALTVPSHAQGAICASTYDAAKKDLAEKWGEHPVWFGTRGDGSVMETYVDDEDGSWTIVVILPDGRVCVATAGNGHGNYDSVSVEPTGLPL